MQMSGFFMKNATACIWYDDARSTLSAIMKITTMADVKVCETCKHEHKNEDGSCSCGCKESK